MKNKMLNSTKMIFSLIMIFFTGYLMLSCSEKISDSEFRQEFRPDPRYVAAVSGGVLGRREPVKVVFTQNQDTSQILSSNAFSLRPATRGDLSWQDEYTLIFTPNEPLSPGLRYQAAVNVKGINPFTFDFITVFPIMNVNLDLVQIDRNGDVLVQGVVIVDEGEDISVIEQSLRSPEMGVPVWVHQNGIHRFIFNSVERLSSSRSVSISWDGSYLGSNDRGFTTVMIPGTDSFEMLNLRLNNGTIDISFSSPLRAYQDLRGFISLSGDTNVRYSIEGNIVRIFGDSSGSLNPGTELVIQDLEDINGQRLAVPVQYTIPDKWELPEIRFAGSGVILPSSQGSQLVVETKNISGLLVEAFHIYGNNMLQFLQVNNLSDEYELDRVGEPLWTKTFDFSFTAMDQNRWVRRGLDL